MDTFLQVWGGSCYLLAKILLSRAEGKKKTGLRQYGWLVYLSGVPAWVILLFQNRNWIAMAIEAGGVPGMVLGLVVAIRGMEQVPRLLDLGTRVFVWVLIFLGVGYSAYDSGGITTFTQILEFGVTVGFLLGTYLLAKADRRGWLCFILMHTSMGILMAMQIKWILVLFQAASIYFAVSGFRRAKKAVVQKHTTLAP